VPLAVAVAVAVRGRLGEWMADGLFAAAFGARGRNLQAVRRGFAPRHRHDHVRKTHYRRVFRT
jgi:hypothetical protein